MPCTLRTPDKWKEQLKRGDIISIPIPDNFDKNGTQKYHPAIVLENNNNNQPIPTLIVQMLTALSNWTDENKNKTNKQNYFYWNSRKQYIESVGFKKISYGLVYSFYHNKQQRFEDSNDAMQKIKSMHNINDDWSNLEPATVLLTADEEQKMNDLEKQLEEQLKLQQENKQLKQKDLTSQQENKQLKQTIIQLQQENKQLKQKDLTLQQELNNLSASSLRQTQIHFNATEINQFHNPKLNPNATIFFPFK